MAKRPTDPVLVNTDQFGSLEEALERVALVRPFEDLAHEIMSSYVARSGKWSLRFAFLGSAVSRGRALHEAIVREIEASNPPGSITLLRQLAETVAMTFYVADNPSYVEVLATRPQDKKPGAPNRKTMQKLINHMDRNYTDQFAIVYADMCEMTHFGTSALWSSHKLASDEGDDLRLSWSSAPVWKYEQDALVCCVLLLELTAGMRFALIKLGETLIRLNDETSSATPPDSASKVP